MNYKSKFSKSDIFLANLSLEKFQEYTTTFQNKFSKCIEKLKIEYETKKVIFNAIIASEKKWNKVNRILNLYILNKGQKSFRKILKEEKKSKFKSSFYAFFGLLIKWFKRPKNSKLLKFIIKPRLPKTKKYKFPPELREKIQNHFLLVKDPKKMCFSNLTNLWLQWKWGAVEDIDISMYRKYQEILANITYKTFIKILCEHSNIILKEPKSVKSGHPLRTYTMETGHVQLDVKITRPKELPKYNKQIKFFAMIDVASKYIHATIINENTLEEMCRCTKEGIENFKKHQIFIKSIRTDHGCSFKMNQCISTDLFNQILLENQIRHEFIPWRTPQANGNIERFFRTIDKEFLLKIKDETDLEKLRQYLKNLLNFTIIKDGTKIPFENILKTILKVIDYLSILFLQK